MEHVVHSIPPTYDKNSRMLVLGSVPSPKSRETQFNYGHPQNRFWRVLAKLAGEPVPATNERKRDFCLRHHIALWDVVAECDIEGASDASIRNPRPNDLASIVQAAPIEAVYCTGAKSFELFNKLKCNEACGMDAVKLPSTSPANAACSFDKLVEAYAPLFEHTHPFDPPTLSVPRVVELEQRIAADGTPLSELMDRAGAALAHRVQEALEAQASEPLPAGFAPKPTVAILCGNGNNGGDGWVAAELLAQLGTDVRLLSAKHPGDLRAQPARDAALRAYDTLADRGATVLIDPGEGQYRSALDGAWVVIDALLGTGYNFSEIKEPFASWIAGLPEAAGCARIVAADVPSGISAQVGSDPSSPNVHVIADETVTMIVPKPGLSDPACGTVRVAPLSYIEPYFEDGEF